MPIDLNSITKPTVLKEDVFGLLVAAPKDLDAVAVETHVRAHVPCGTSTGWQMSTYHPHNGRIADDAPHLRAWLFNL